jgi:hypothetical protein
VLIPTITRAHSATEHSEPKTVLGFFLAFFAIFAASIVGIVVALVSTGHAELAAVVLAVGFVTAAWILIWVARTHTRNPTALMLGHVTARDYLAVQQWTAGDSTVGEYLSGSASLAVASERLALLSASEMATESVVGGGDTEALHDDVELRHEQAGESETENHPPDSDAQLKERGERL